MNTFETFQDLFKSLIENVSDPAILINETGEIICINQNAKSVIIFENEVKFIQNYLMSSSWEELQNILNLKTQLSEKVRLDAFKLKLKNGQIVSEELLVEQITLEKSHFFLIKILTSFIPASASSLKNFSILSSELESNVNDPLIKEIINEFINHYPLTFIEKESIEQQADELDEMFWIKNELGYFIIANKALCDNLGFKKSQIEGKNYKEFIPPYLLKLFESLDEFQKASKSSIAYKGVTAFNISLSEEREIVEIPLISSDIKIIALVGFSRKYSSYLPIKKTDLDEKLLRNLISLLPLPAVILDKARNFRLYNEEFCKLFNRNLEDIQKSKSEELFPRELCEFISNFTKSDSDGIIIELNEKFEVISKPGNGFNLYINRFFQKEIREELIALFFQKSTQLEIRNKTLLSKETMSDILIKNNPNPIFIYDKENLRFLDANDAAQNLYGYSRDEFLQMDLTDLYTPEDIQTLLETSKDTLKEGEFGKPFRHRKKDGSYLFVRISKISYQFDDVEAYYNILENVTERLELDKKNQLFKTAFDNTSDMIFITDPEGIITFANDSSSRNLGIPKLELVNTSITSHCDDEDRLFINSSVFQSHIKETVTFTIKLKTSEGHLIETDMTSTPIFDVNNEVELFSLIARVQTPSILIPSEKQEVIREVIKEVVKEVVVEKPVLMETKHTELGGTFLSGVFHEILTPMNVILGFAQELTESIENLSPEQKEAVDIINQNRSSLLGLMNSIIEFSDMQSNKTEAEIIEVPITDIVEPLDKNIKDITGLREIEFAYGKISSSLKFTTDKKKFENLLNNLIRLVGRITSQKKIYFSAYPVEDDSFNISVSDGFARSSIPLLETLKKLFIGKKDPKEVGISKLNFQIISSLLDILDGHFVTINEFTDKHDIAFRFPLTLTGKIKTPAVKEIKESFISKKEIEIEKPLEKDEPEHFILSEEIEMEEEVISPSKEENVDFAEVKNLEQELQEPPEQLVEETIHVEEVTSVKAPETPTHKNGVSSLRCLYIEDQIDSQILFKVQMKDLKSIQFAASFEEALPLLETHDFDFIVMDINLQGEYNGLDALRVINQMPRFENVPVIAVTAYVLPGDKDKFIATGFTDFISKPIFREKMLESLKKIFVN